MKAANLTTLQRAAILDDLRKGKSVPVSLLRYEVPCIQPIHKKPIFSAKKNKKRKRETIIKSGAYEVPKFVQQPLSKFQVHVTGPPKTDFENEKYTIILYAIPTCAIGNSNLGGWGHAAPPNAVST